MLTLRALSTRSGKVPLPPEVLIHSRVVQFWKQQL